MRRMVTGLEKSTTCCSASMVHQREPQAFPVRPCHSRSQSVLQVCHTTVPLRRHAGQGPLLALPPPGGQVRPVEPLAPEQSTSHPRLRAGIRVGHHLCVVVCGEPPPYRLPGTPQPGSRRPLGHRILLPPIMGSPPSVLYRNRPAGGYPTHVRQKGRLSAPCWCCFLGLPFGRLQVCDFAHSWGEGGAMQKLNGCLKNAKG